MPRLIVLAPCDNVLLDKEDAASLITIMTGVSLPKPSENTPPDSVGPMRWFIFCQWLVYTTDMGKTFEQRLRFGSDNLELLGAIQEMKFEHDKLHHRMVAGMTLFPIVDQGTYLIRVDYREKGSEEWNPAGVYPLLVGHT